MERKLLPLKSGEPSLGVIFPRFSGLDAKIMIEKEVLQEQDFVRNEFKKFGFNPEIQIVAIEPTDARNSAGREPGKKLGRDHPLLL